MIPETLPGTVVDDRNVGAERARLWHHRLERPGHPVVLLGHDIAEILLVHGLAGSAAVALLVLTTLHNTRWAVAYLFIFGVGTIAGMMVITVAMASALNYAGSRSQWINRRLSLATGVLSVAFGLFLVYQMGFHHGLFTSHPVWTPE